MRTVQDLRHFSSGIAEPYIFISYAHDDRDVVEKLVRRLEENGYCVWVDYQNIRGRHFSDDIKNGIRECAVFLQCISRTYISSAYCEKEYIFADDENRPFLPVAIDSIRKTENPNAFPFGGNIYCYGSGLRDQFEEGCSSLLTAAVLIAMKGEEDPQYIFAGQKLMAVLKDYCDNTYRWSGSYILSEIHRELFTDIQDKESSEIYGGEECTEVALYNFVKSDNSTDPAVLVGEGGTGKTLSMIRTCRRLLEEGICALYIPLSKVYFYGIEDPVKHYIRKRIFGEDDTLFRSFSGMLNSGVANNVYLFLDGVNELNKDALEKFRKFVSDCLFTKEWSGTRIIISSRTDFSIESTDGGKQDISVRKLIVQPLGEERIRAYLEKLSIPYPDNAGIVGILSNPLMLNLYADAEKYTLAYRKKGEEKIEGFSITMDPQPDTPSKIIGNYMQTQLYQMAAVSEKKSDFLLYFTMVYYTLPAVAFRMITSDRPVSESSLKHILLSCLSDEDPHFRWFSRQGGKFDDLLWEYEEDESYLHNNIKKIHRFAIKNFRFLYNVSNSDAGDSTVEFLHQEFRDYYAGVYLAHEVEMIQNASAYGFHSYNDMDISHIIDAPGVLEYCSGFLREEDACPVMLEDRYEFPGKKDREPSRFSAAEKALSCLRHKREESDHGVSGVVSNLMKIIGIGRKRCLAQCDFSFLDLRQCRMNGYHFSAYQMGHTYASTFDNSIMDHNFFMNDGHAVSVCKVIEGADGWIYSADKSGELIRWKYQTDELSVLRNYNDLPKDMAYDEKTGRLCIALEHQISLIDCVHLKELYSRYNEEGTKYFRYVRFSPDGSVQYTYDLEPFRWFELLTGTEQENAELSVFSDCAYECPKHGKIIYSVVGRNICVLDISKLRKALNPVAYITGNMRRVLWDLSEKNRGTAARLNAIAIDRDETRFAVAVGNQIVEYELTDQLGSELSVRDISPLRIINLDCTIQDIRYLRSGGFIIGAGHSVDILNDHGNVIHSMRKKSIATVLQFSEAVYNEDKGNSNGDRFYLMSGDGNLKRLDDHLRVESIRYIGLSSRFVWVQDRKTHEIQMMFNGGKTYPNGSRVSFESGKTIPAGWCFKSYEYGSSERLCYRCYSMEQSVVLYVLGSKPQMYEYINVSGVWIFGCSFLNMSGEMSSQQYQKFLISNGGITGEL